MKKRILLYFILIPGFVFSQTPDMNLLKARACIDQNKIDSALVILMPYKQASGLSSLWIGDCYYQRKDFTRAARYYLLADSINNGTACYQLARCYAKSNNKEKALQWLQKYLASANKKSELEVTTDSAFASLSKTLEWRAVWQKDWYSESEVERNAILALVAKGRVGEASSELENAENKFSPRHQFYYLQAKVFEKQQLLGPAISASEKAVSMNSFSEDYLVLHANLLQTNKKYKAALDNITKAIRLNPYNPKLYLKRGEIARLAGNYDLAEKDLQLFCRLYPDVADTYHQLGLMEVSKGNNQNAMEFYDVLLQKDKSHAWFYVERGNLALTLEQIQKADEDFSLALDLNPNIQEAYLKKGSTLHILNDNAGACFYWKKARELGSSEAANLLYKNCKEENL
jgi:tetratricopeptide (TPR) repeat protein